MCPLVLFCVYFLYRFYSRYYFFCLNGLNSTFNLTIWPWHLTKVSVFRRLHMKASGISVIMHCHWLPFKKDYCVARLRVINMRKLYYGAHLCDNLITVSVTLVETVNFSSRDGSLDLMNRIGYVLFCCLCLCKCCCCYI